MNKNNRLSSIEIIRRIFNTFALNQAPLTAKEISQQTNIPQSTLYKFLTELKKINFINMNQKKYFIGEKIAVYGELYNTNHTKLESIKKIAKDISKETGLTSQICTIVQGKYMVIYENIPDTDYAIRSLVLGRNIPITWTASGRLLLEAKNREDLLRQISLENLKLPDGRQISLDELYNEITKAHKLNYAEFKSPINDNCICMATLILKENIAKYTLCLSIKKEHADEIKNKTTETLLKYRQRYFKKINSTIIE